MLKLGTVFSGIGAIEHALKRIGINYQVAFACDSGGVDIFSKKIERDLFAIASEIDSLHQRVDEVANEHFNDDYALSLMEHMLHINQLEEELKELSRELGQEIIRSESSKKTLEVFLENLKSLEIEKKPSLFLKHFVGTALEQIETHHYFYLVKDFKEYYKEYPNNKELEKIVGISFTRVNEEFTEFSKKAEVKALNKMLNEIIDMINMLHQRISTVEHLDELSRLSTYEEKKQYVDNLYKGKEKSNFVMQSYKANYEIEDKHFHWNASFLDGSQYTDEIDLFVGGSPCQAFSLVGKRRGLTDTRGTLFYEFARLISEIRPKVFIYENVKGLLDHDGGNTWATMKEVFNELDYDWKLDILNAKNYGVPQNRERLFVVGFRRDLVLSKEFEFPSPVPLDKTMKDFLLDNVSGKYYLNKKGVDFVTKEKNIVKRYTQIDGDIQLCQKANQQFNWHGDFVFVEENKDKEKMMEDLEKYFLSEKVSKYVLASGTKNFYSKPAIDLDIARPLLTTMHKMHRAGIDNYVTTEGRIRKLTPRECLRLMGFCDSFKMVVSDTQIYQQAGNSIVVDVLISIVESIKESLPQILEGNNYEYHEREATPKNTRNDDMHEEQLELEFI